MSKPTPCKHGRHFCIECHYDARSPGRTLEQMYDAAVSERDTLTQRLQEAERLLHEVAAELDDWRQSFPDANSHDTDVLTEQIGAFLAGKGDKP